MLSSCYQKPNDEPEIENDFSQMKSMIDVENYQMTEKKMKS